jgi:aminopeptidase N
MKMKIYFNPVLLVLLVIFNCPNLIQAKNNHYKTLTVPKQIQTIDIKHLILNLKFNWKKRQAYGTATLTLAPLSRIKKIHLDAAMLSINSISIKNNKLGFKYDDANKNGALEIILDKVYQINDTIQLTIDYHTNYENKSDPNNISGSFGKGIRFLEPSSTTPLKRKQIWSSGEPENNRYWFPCSDNLNDIRTSEFVATVDKPLIAISNGNLFSIKDNHDGTQTFHYKSDKAYPNYLSSFVVGEYTDIKQNAGNISLHTYAYPDEKNAAEATVVLLPDMMQFISQKTGLNYPYDQYSQVVVQDYPFPGLNGQNTAGTISDNYIDDEGTHADFLYLWDGIATQAMASQWFGNCIMPKSWEHIWLNQAFCQYFAGQYSDFKNGHAEYLTYYLPFEKSAVLADWQADYKHPIVPNRIKDINSFSSDNYVKYKGALVLRMLQKELGEENWWKAIKLYVKTNANKQVTTIDFQKAIETITGKSYQWFFDQWIYKIGLPKFTVTKKYDHEKKQLVIHVLQSQKLDTIKEYEQVPFFQGKMTIELNDKIESVFLEPKAANDFTFLLDDAPKLVNLDFESTWLCEMTFEKSYAELLYQLENSKDVLAKQSAIEELVKLITNNKTSESDKAKVLKVLRKEINSTAYWRYRSYALSKLRNIESAPYDNEITAMLLNLIANDKSWVKTSAIFTLGNTKNDKYVDIYINALSDKSDRVANAAAIALGKTKSAKAFDALIALDKKPSWKNQSRISALNGLQELADTRGAEFALRCLEDIQSPRWYLATPIWDYPLAAVQTLVALEKGNMAYSLLLERFKKSLTENDNNDIFANALLLTNLADARGQEVYELLKTKFKTDEYILTAVHQLENQYKASIKK